jgi:hypothetical protein
VKDREFVFNQKSACVSKTKQETKRGVKASLDAIDQFELQRYCRADDTVA